MILVSICILVIEFLIGKSYYTTLVLGACIVSVNIIVIGSKADEKREGKCRSEDD